MKCRRCNHPSTRVVETRVQDDGITKRRRACDDCGFRFNSYEIPPEAYTSLRAGISQWQKRLVSSHALRKRQQAVLGKAAVAQFKQGWTIAAVAAHYKVPVLVASKWSKSYREQTEAPIKDAFRRDVGQGLSVKALAEKYNLSVEAAEARRYRIRRASRRHSGDAQLHRGADDER